MIELPPAASVNLGLERRKFRIRPAPDMSDRSQWTDTPADRARKRMEKVRLSKFIQFSTNYIHIRETWLKFFEFQLESRSVLPVPPINVEREEQCDESRDDEKKSEKRQKSLMELHQKKLNKKKRKEEKERKKIGKPVERRPFDRDVDLQANRFDAARKKSIVMKARELNDRFSRGNM